MNNLLTAIMTKLTGSALSSDVGGRIFADEAPDGAPFPYVIFLIISDVPDNTFTDDLHEILIQFSLYSTSSGLAEITDMYADLKALFDDCTLAITSTTFLFMKRQSMTTMFDAITTPAGEVGVRHWAADYIIKTRTS